MSTRSGCLKLSRQLIKYILSSVSVLIRDLPRVEYTKQNGDLLIRDNNTQEGTFQKLINGRSENLDPEKVHKFNIRNDKVALQIGGKGRFKLDYSRLRAHILRRTAKPKG